MVKFAAAALVAFACMVSAPSAAQNLSNPAPAQQAAPIMIFFDWGSSKLSSDATAALDGVLADAKLQPGSTVRLEAFSDRSGSRWSSLVMSVARARAARDYLVNHGFDASAIKIRPYGEARPLVRTADGVREVQNRRVEISVSGN